MATKAPAKTIDPQAARSALAEEWAAQSPRTPAEILDFYRRSEHLEADLEAFHSFPERQRWTQILLHTVISSEAQSVIDIGSGAGHDLRELAGLGWGWLWPTDHEEYKAERVKLCGVEPNDALRQRTAAELGIPMYADIAEAPIELAEIVSCFDVLEHLPDPEGWLGSIAERLAVGSVIIETAAPFDLGTPLHLDTNQGWHPGHCLQSHGFQLLNEEGRLRIWIKVQAAPIAQKMLAVCAAKHIDCVTFDSVMHLVGAPGMHDWKVSRASESGLLRARSIYASRWLRETCGDGFVFVDSDIGFAPRDLESIVRWGREKRSIVVAAYSVRDGGHLAMRGNQELNGVITFGPNLEPVEILYGATGFMYIHRDVLAAMVAGDPAKGIEPLKLCHANMPWALWPFFDFNVVPDPAAGGYNWLSEDWEFCRRAKALGFPTWLDRTIKLRHMGDVAFTVDNMAAIREAVQYVPQMMTLEEAEGPGAKLAAPIANGHVNRAERRAARKRKR